MIITFGGLDFIFGCGVLAAIIAIGVIVALSVFKRIPLR